MFRNYVGIPGIALFKKRIFVYSLFKEIKAYLLSKTCVSNIKKARANYIRA